MKALTYFGILVLLLSSCLIAANKDIEDKAKKANIIKKQLDDCLAKPNLSEQEKQDCYNLKLQYDSIINDIQETEFRYMKYNARKEIDYNYGIQNAGIDLKQSAIFNFSAIGLSILGSVLSIKNQTLGLTLIGSAGIINLIGIYKIYTAGKKLDTVTGIGK